jgi:hypothetical protein
MLLEDLFQTYGEPSPALIGALFEELEEFQASLQRGAGGGLSRTTRPRELQGGR